MMILSSIFFTIILVINCGEAGNENSKYRLEPATSRGQIQTHQQVRWRLTATANLFFAHRLYSNIARSQKTGNILISPFVISTGLSMTLGGAESETERELMKAMEYDELEKRNGGTYTKDDVPRLYRNLLHQVRNNQMLLVACRLYGDRSETFLPAFVRNTERNYGAQLQQVDFAGDTEGARNEINDWVRNKTMNTIQEAMPSGAVSSATLLALVSTVYFKGNWEHEFDRANTYEGVFKAQDNVKIPIDFMKAKLRLKYRYSHRTMSHILILPYKKTEGSRHSRSVQIEMQLFLPLKGGTLAIWEQAGESLFHQEIHEAETTTVELHLPKFRIEYGTDLRPSLERLNINTLFGEADLSGMNGKRNLNFGSMWHKTFLQVDEEGTTAGASFVQSLNKASNDVRLYFDRPFLIIIKERFTKSILFMGRVARPL